MATPRGGLIAVNHLSGQHVTGFTERRSLFLRKAESAFTLENLVRSLLFASL